MEPMQLGNYKLGRQKLLAALYKMGACHTDFPGFPRVVHLYLYTYVTRQTDRQKKQIGQCIMLYMCEYYFFSYIFSPLIL